MEETKLKNMVILKNLESNIVEEAIVILKNNKKAKKLELIENIKNLENKEVKKKDNEYVIKEAQIVVTEYMSKIEQNQKIKKDNLIQKREHTRLKNYAYISTFIMLIQLIILITN